MIHSSPSSSTLASDNDTTILDNNNNNNTNNTTNDDENNINKEDETEDNESCINDESLSSPISERKVKMPTKSCFSSGHNHSHVRYFIPANSNINNNNREYSTIPRGNYQYQMYMDNMAYQHNNNNNNNMPPPPNYMSIQKSNGPFLYNPQMIRQTNNANKRNSRVINEYPQQQYSTFQNYQWQQQQQYKNKNKIQMNGSKNNLNNINLNSIPSGTEFVSIRYLAPVQQINSILAKGESINSLTRQHFFNLTNDPTSNSISKKQQQQQQQQQDSTKSSNKKKSNSIIFIE
jgi:hypothetical protein